MFETLLNPIWNNWQSLTRRRIDMQLREAPLRDELYTRLFLFAAAALVLQFGLLWWEGVRGWNNRGGAFGFGFLTAFPAIFLLFGHILRKKIPPFAFLLSGFATMFTLPIAPAASQNFDYPQFGGALMLTIIVAGLLAGKTFVRVWTAACVAIQMANVPSTGPTLHSWMVNALWGLFILTTGWLVNLFSWHVERLDLAARASEEQQRNAIVAERTRFARDIHDTLAQGFTGIMMQLNAAEQRLGASEEARAHIENARRLASDSLEEARRSVSALRSGTLAEGSLIGAIERIGRTLTSDSGAKIETEVEGRPYALPQKYEANLLRIAQEALTNAVRHSEAERIIVRLAYRTGSVMLEIADTGRGMTGEEPSGFGVDGMRERAREIGGEINILSDPGRGTRIIVTVFNV